jgi:hypothetical protein
LHHSRSPNTIPDKPTSVHVMMSVVGPRSAFASGSCAAPPLLEAMESFGGKGRLDVRGSGPRPGREQFFAVSRLGHRRREVERSKRKNLMRAGQQLEQRGRKTGRKSQRNTDEGRPRPNGPAIKDVYWSSLQNSPSNPRKRRCPLWPGSETQRTFHDATM